MFHRDRLLRRSTRALLLLALSSVLAANPASADEPAKATGGWRKLTEPRTRSVTGLAFSTRGDGRSVGSALPLTVSIAPASDGRMRVGFFESDVGGSGGMWEASGWMATIAAIEMTGYDPRTLRISFDVSGYADGPSAGGLLTVGVLAALLDHPVREDAAMTGTINPDGTIGPVGGIAHKIEGAAQAGKKLVVIPAGVRMQLDKNLEEEVDLVQRGVDLGVEVREVRDVYEAYRLLTGHEIARPRDGAHPRMSPAGYALVKRNTEAWLRRYEEVKSRYEELSDDVISEHMEEAVVDSEKMADSVARLLREGEIGGGYINAYSAASEMDAVLQLGRSIAIYDASGLDAMREGAVGIQPVKHLLNALAKLKLYEPKTVGDATGLISAYASLAVGVGYAAAAEQSLDRKSEDEDEQYGEIYNAVYLSCMAVSQSHLANQSLAMCRDSGDAPLPADLPLEAAATFFHQAATANLNVFEAVVVNSTAKELNVGPTAIQQLIYDNDDDYAIVRANSTATLPVLAAQLGPDTKAFQYAKLGTAIEAYVLSSSLVARYYSLGMVHENFVPVRLEREAPMMNMLEFAESQSRRSVNLLTEHGIEARWPIASYGIGRANRNSDDLYLKLYALQNYWEAHVTARAIAFLAGFAAPE